MKTHIVLLLGGAVLLAPVRTLADEAPVSRPRVSSEGRAGESAIHARPGDAKLQWGPCPPIFPKGCEIAVLHGDPAQDDADVFLRVPARYVIPAHRHTSPERMTLVSGELEVTYAGEKPFTMRVGSYAYGPAQAPHVARCVSKEACVLFIAFVSAVDAEPAAMTK